MKWQYSLGSCGWLTGPCSCPHRGFNRLRLRGAADIRTQSPRPSIMAIISRKFFLAFPMRMVFCSTRAFAYRRNSQRALSAWFNFLTAFTASMSAWFCALTALMLLRREKLLTATFLRWNANGQASTTRAMQRGCGKYSLEAQRFFWVQLPGSIWRIWSVNCNRIVMALLHSCFEGLVGPPRRSRLWTQALMREPITGCTAATLWMSQNLWGQLSTNSYCCITLFLRGVAVPCTH